MSLNTTSNRISLKDNFCYDEKWFLTNDQIEKLLDKYWLPEELINYYLDAHDNVKSEWNNKKPQRIRSKLNDFAKKSDSAYTQTVINNFEFETGHHLFFFT